MRAEVMAGLREVVADARGRGLSAPVWLFGSFAWGAPDRWSDVDLAVPTAADAELLGRACDGRVARDVHLVALDAAAPTLGERVRAEGLAL